MGVLEAGVTLNILAFCRASDKSQSRMEDEEASWQYVNIPGVRSVHAGVFCILWLLSCIPVLCFLGMKAVLLTDSDTSRLVYVGGPIHVLCVFQSPCAYADASSHLSGYLLPSFRVLSNLL